MALTSLTFVDSATSTTSTVAIPGTAAAGDLLVLLDRAGDTVVIPQASPDGFTRIGGDLWGLSGGTVLYQQILSYGIYAGGGGSLTGMNGNTSNRKVLLVFRGDVPITSVTSGSVNAQLVDTNPAAQNVTASGGTPPLIVIGAYGSTGTVNPRTFSPAKDGEVLNQSGNNNIALAYKIYNSSPADVSIDMDDEGNVNILYSAYLECEGASAVETPVDVDIAMSAGVSVSRAVSKRVAATADTAASVTKSVATSIAAAASAAVNVTSGLAYLMVVTAGVVVSANVTLLRLFSAIVTISVSAAVSVSRGVSKSIAVPIDVAISITKAIPRSVTIAASAAAVVLKSAGKSLSAAISASVVVGRMFAVLVSIGVSASASIRRSITKTLNLLVRLTSRGSAGNAADVSLEPVPTPGGANLNPTAAPTGVTLHSVVDAGGATLHPVNTQSDF